MELGPLWSGRAEELAANVDTDEVEQRLPIQVPTGTEIQEQDHR